MLNKFNIYCLIYFCLACLILSINSPTFANNFNSYLKAPNPFVYKKPSELWGKKSYEKLITDWFVFSDRDNLQLYDSPEEKKGVQSVNFLDKFRVLNLTQTHIEVESMDKKIKGWGPIKAFIILTHAYKTENAITHKAVLINKIGSIKGDINAVKPFRAPFSNANTTEESIRILEFANIYSYYPNEQNARFVLLGKGPYFLPHTGLKDSSIENIMLGWVPASRVLTWDTREALQPNPQRKNPIYYFKNENDLQSYYNVHAEDNMYPTCENVPSCKRSNRDDKELLVIRPDYEDKIDRKEWPKKLFRYAILRSNNDISNPFEIGVTSATLDERVFKRNISEAIETQRKKLENRDVVFLIDATMSMGPYFVLVGEIVKDIMDQFNQKKRQQNEVGELRFGVALYRDYLNKSKCFEINNKYGYLTANVLKTKRYLETIKPLRSYEKPDDPAYYPEAVFQGLINTVDQMNWQKGSRRLIIHIGDVGNNSRGLDNINEQGIAKQLAENDISYCAIQMIGQSQNEEHSDAQSLFCMQTRSIIKETAKNVLNIVQHNKDMKIFSQNNVQHLQALVDDAKVIDCAKVSGVCSSFGDRRWLLRCITSNNKGEYQKTISEQIHQLASDIFEAKSILDDIRQGKTVDSAIKEIYTSEKNVSSKPFLMPGVINSLIVEIGNELLSKKDDPKIYGKILKYVGPSRIKQIDDPKAKKEIIQIVGKQELQTYLKDDVNFFTKSYVYLRRPGKKFEKDPDQLIKTILFQKKELEKLLRSLSEFVDKWHCQIHPDNLARTWKEFMLAILGEHSDAPEDTIDKSQSIKTLYEKQFGLSLRHSHPLLQIEYAKIEKGDIPKNIDINALAIYLCSTHKRLKKIYFNEKSYFSIFGNKFIWIDASQLP
ncbi:conserved hypothetical protein, secreted [Candidatus Magnetomorum sp. HK-1]|nr:conserved hypothetical protein, secreted [Candidatus Magnetomorum sp. HK-1]